MSGSGGYYKFRCKNWMTWECQNWVWVNGASCSSCMAQGRGIGSGPSTYFAREICVPQFCNGCFSYTTMEILIGDTTEAGWQLKDRPQADVILPKEDISEISETLNFPVPPSS